MLGKMPRVGISKFEGIENAYILVSCKKKTREYDPGFNIMPMMSFLYDGGNFAAEWEPQYGPIQVWTKANAPGDGIKEHYFYDYVLDEGLNWSQLAVENNCLKERFFEGDYRGIFRVLAEWANR